MKKAFAYWKTLKADILTESDEDYSFVYDQGFHIINKRPKNLTYTPKIADDTRHRSVNNFAINLITGIIAYNLLPKKPELNLEIIHNPSTHLVPHA